MKFATFRLGKTSVADIRTIDAAVAGVLQQPLDITVSCTQLPDAVDSDTYVFVWLGSDNSKGIPTAWKQGFKAFGRVLSVDRGEKFNDESSTIIRILFVFRGAINRLDVLRDAPVEYYWCSALPVIGLDDHSNQTARVLERKSELCRVEAFFTALNKVDGTFKKSICQIDSSFMGLFCESFKKPQVDEKPLRDGFIDWLQKYDEPIKTPKHAKEYADTYLYAINKDPISGHDNPCVNIWNDLYKFLYGKKAERDVFHVKGLADFQLIYGDIARVFAEEKDAGPLEVEKFEQAYAWAHTAGNKGHVRASYRAYVRYLEWRESQTNTENTDDSVDILSQALKLFNLKRSEIEWCADNTDNDATKPRAGYLANAKLRAAMPMTNNLGTDAQVVQWFKDYSYPDGKSWLDGIDTNGCAAFGGYINYLVAGGAAVARPEKFTRSLESAVKAIVKPEGECFYNKDIHSVLKYLGLLRFEFKEDYDEDDYQDALHAQRVIKRRLKDMGEKQIVEWDAAANQAKPNDKEPDFLTVNEFLWFVKENKQEISRIAKEKAMAKQQKKPTKEKVTTGEATISELLANKEDSLMTMLTAALLTKPLVILAGVSGTGKSRMVRHLAYKTCLDKDLQPQGGNAPGNFKMIQVKPNWHDSADLLGYRSVVSGDHEFVTTEFVKFVLKAHAYPDTPFFVCLDEMNLAPVEHYFAEFLSACESIRKNEQNVWISDPIVSPTDFDGEIINLGGDVKFESDDAALDAALKARKALIEKEGLFIPRNLFVVGTVNMDDTTNGFSRKVLDRAMTIEMNEVKFDELQKKDEGLSVAAANVFTPTEVKKFIDRADFDGQAMLNNEFRDQMESLRGKLEKSPFALAYRFARETTLYRKALMTILDQAKVVLDGNGQPKLDGSATIDAKRACGEIALDHMILMKVLPRFTGTVTERETIIKDVGEYLDALIKDKKVGKVKLDDMVERAKHNGGYLSFWP